MTMGRVACGRKNVELASEVQNITCLGCLASIQKEAIAHVADLKGRIFEAENELYTVYQQIKSIESKRRPVL